MEKKKYFKSTPNYAKKDGYNKSYKRNESFKKDNLKGKDKENLKQVNVRYYIYQCLYNIYVKKAFVNIEVDHIIRKKDLSIQDKNLLTKVVYGTLQKDYLLNWEIKKLSDKRPKDEAKIILLMSLYQLHFLDKVPPFAIINEAVEVAKKVQGEFVAKYVNAILRESTRQNLTLKEEDCKNHYEYLSILYNTPVFVIKMWERHYGMDKTMQILIANSKEAPLAVRCNVDKQLILKNPNFIEGKLAKNSLIYVGNDLLNEVEFKNKEISIQDESSQYVVDMLSPKENDRIIDMCAAPGSKSAYISKLIGSGKLLSIDIYPHRVELMEKYFKELGLNNVTCVCYDSTSLYKKEKLLHSFDKVLLDAPCSGLGVIRRKPDIVFDLSSDKLDELVALQEKLLDQAYLLVKDDGEILYSTCSINKKENDSQITTFLAKHPDMKRIFEKQIFPDEYDSDGFYIAKLVKK